jgi:hypothetical protein
MNDEIERSEWAGYFNEFSKRNQMRPTRVEVFGEELGAQEQERGLPLSGISLDSHGAHSPRVEIMLGGEMAGDARHLSHTITRVRRVMRKLSADGKDEALVIENEDGAKTLIRFEALRELGAVSS